MKRKSPGYWNNFANVQEALLTYIAEHGTPGIMPTHGELRGAKRYDLLNALDKHGGTAVIAAQLKLKFASKAKPPHYWNDIIIVEQEIRSFIQEHGTPGIMPTLEDLEKVERGDLSSAIQKHGGFPTLAQRLGLALAYKKKPKKYWSDFANVEQELKAFIAEYGTPGVMPTDNELRDLGKADLSHAIQMHHGFEVVAQRLTLSLSYIKKKRQYWSDFANVEQELKAFIAEHGTLGVMPTNNELRDLGRGDLSHAIQIHHGSEAIAQRLNLTMSSMAKSSGYWNINTIREALGTFIAEHGTPGVMPTDNELKRAGRHDLRKAIYLQGGIRSVAQQLELEKSNQKKPRGYWLDRKNVEQDLLQFIKEHGTPGVMPTSNELIEAQYSALGAAIRHHGGFHAMAQQLGLEVHNSYKPQGFWDDFDLFAQELLLFQQQQGTVGLMPTAEDLRVAKRHDLSSAISNKHGGFRSVAQRLGHSLSHTKKPGGFWEDFTNVEQAIRAVATATGRADVMPSAKDLQLAGYSSLVPAIIDKHEGFSAVAHRLGLYYTGQKHITARTIADIERIVRALQPLAESNLLSGAQVMIIQRRAGMFDYRNSHITQLNASLSHGNHDAIELALVQLRNAPEEEIAAPLEDEEAFSQEGLAETGLEVIVGSEFPIEEERPSSTHTAPDFHQEQIAIRGLSALGAIRLPLDETLGLLTSKILWEAFYKRLYAWYGSLHTTQTVTTDDVQGAVLSAYAGQIDNEFVVQAAVKFTQEVEQAINFAAKLSIYGWTGPHLRLHQADAARWMTDILMKKEPAPFLLNADDPGMGKSASFLAAVVASGIRRIILLAPKTVADDTWADPHGEIRACLAHASIVRGLRETLDTLSLASGTSPVFFVLHYEELLDDEMVDRLANEQFDCLCIDEIHFVKQRGGQKETYRREALKKIRAATQSAIGLTGTPLVNELAEPLSLLQVLSHQDRQFDYTRLNNHRMGDIADVFEAILPHIVRRRKKDVLLHLPLCDVRPVEIPLQDDLLEPIRTIGMLPKAQANNALAELRKITLQAKLPSIRKRAESAKKLLVLTYLRDEISEEIYTDLQDFFPGQVGQINGMIPKEQRKEILDAFRAPNGLRILVGTIGTIGVGLTLFDPTQEQTAHEIIVADLPYTAAEFDQGIARLHREGQKHRVVVDVLLTTTNVLLYDGSPLRTIDQRIWDLILGKRELSDVAIDGLYAMTDAATKVRKALHRWLKQIRETGVEPLIAEQRPAELSATQKWRGEIARLRGMSTTKADELFTDNEYTRAFLDHLRTSGASQLAYLWLRAKLEYLLRSDLRVVDMGCGLNPFADLPCHVTGLDRHGLSGQVKGKMEKPPFPDASADILIYSLSLYGTADDLRAYFTQARRILRGGGHLFVVEPGTTFTPEGLTHFVSDLQQFGFEQVGNIRDIRGEDGVVLTGMHFTLTGEVGTPKETRFERK